MAEYLVQFKGFDAIKDDIGHAVHELHELGTHRVYIGAFKAINDRSVDFMQMICSVQNFGCEIKPKNGKYLTIPTPVAGNHSARYFGKYSSTNKRGLFFHLSESGRPTLAANIDGQLKVFFLLTKQVNIPARDFMNRSAEISVNMVNRIIQNDANYYFTGDGNYRNTLNKIGRYVSYVVVHEIKQWNSPSNAQITQANKGKDDPLVDTGALQKSISWVIE